MAEDKQDEPSIEEILASIRQIISDDDEEADETAAEEEAVVEETPEPEPVVEPEPEPEPEPVAVAEPEEDFDAMVAEADDEEVFELTDELIEDELLDDELPEADETLMSDMDIDFGEDDGADSVEEEVEVEMPEEEVAAVEQDERDAIIEGVTAAATLGAFERLAQSIPVARPGGQGHTLEDIVRDMLRPMLRQWVDENLPNIAERLVKKELERLVDKALD